MPSNGQVTITVTDEYYLLQLGMIRFPVNDMPEKLGVDSSRMVSVRQFPGGFVLAQDLGPLSKQIRFSGTIRYIDDESGLSAIQRAQAIDVMRARGGIQNLIAPGGFSRRVVIKDFNIVYHHDNEVDYDITLTPVDGGQALLSASIYNNGGSSADGGVTITVSNPTPSSSSTNPPPVTKTTPTPPSSPAPSPSSSSSSVYIVVQGDSLWKIALKKLGNGERFKDIVALNHLKSTTIQPGQRLLLPTSSHSQPSYPPPPVPAGTGGLKGRPHPI